MTTTQNDIDPIDTDTLVEDISTSLLLDCAASLLGPDVERAPSDAPEYTRGVCELLADLLDVQGDDKRERILALLAQRA